MFVPLEILPVMISFNKKCQLEKTTEQKAALAQRQMKVARIELPKNGRNH